MKQLKLEGSFIDVKAFNNNYTEKENGTRCCDHGCLVNKKWFKGL